MAGGSLGAGGRRRPDREPTGGPLRPFSDKPVERGDDDRLGFEGYADGLAELIDNVETETPLTIAISGLWGGGKTSLSYLVAEQLTRRTKARRAPPHIVCRFNALSHEQAPHLGAAFAADIARTANRHRGRLRRLLHPLPSAMLSAEERRRRGLGMALGSLAVAGVLVLLPDIGELVRRSFGPKQATGDQVLELLGPTQAAAVLALLAAFALSRKVLAIAQSLAKFVDDPKSEAAKGSMGQISAQLGQLIQQATRAPSRWYQLPERRRPRRFVIFVDDLERLPPPGAVEVCEAATQLLGHPNVVTVLMADMSKVAASAGVKYAALETLGHGNGPAPSYGSEYIKKLVQYQFSLPRPSTAEIDRMLEERAPRVENDLGAQLQASVFRLLVAGLVAGAVPLGIEYLRDRLDPSAAAVSLLGGVRWGPLLLASFLVYLAVEAAVVLRALRSSHRSQAERRIDDLIRRQGASDPTPEELVAIVLPLVAAPGPWQRRVDRLWPGGVARRSRRRRELVEQRVGRYRIEREPHRLEAVAELKQHVPMVPRDAKRMLGHLHLVLVMAERRQVFGGRPELCGRHLGKWTALQERWPYVAAALTEDHRRIVGLEEVSSLEELEKALGACGLQGGAEPPLLGFFQSPTKLAPVIERLVTFRPADHDGPPGRAR